MNIKYVLFLFLTIQFSGCGKDQNEKPMLHLMHDANGLEVTITGSVVDTDGTMSEVVIAWGEKGLSKKIEANFSDLNESHVYKEPADYSITITAKDQAGDSTTQVINLSLDFKETSLEGIRQTMFKTADGEYLFLTINLHTYQEKQQGEKFHLLTDVIGKMGIDFIAFQECAQHKSATVVDGIVRDDNMALIIANNLKEKYNIDYNFTWDWAHYGWNVWEEGSATLAKYPLIETDSRYISASTGTGSIISRKVVYGSYEVPTIGRINLFSAHTHWRTSEGSEEQNNQIRNIQSMAVEKESTITGDVTTFVCGDFNVNPTSGFPWSEGYNTMVKNNDYTDSFLKANPDANNRPAQSKYNTIGGSFPGRIDYIFIKDTNKFEVIDSQIIFKNDVVGKVSDHFGVITKVRWVD